MNKRTQIKTERVSIINLLDVVKAAGEEKGAGYPIWDEVMGHWHGNQTFHNDSLFIYVLPSFNGDPLSPVQQCIADLCHEIIKDHRIIFDVCW